MLKRCILFKAAVFIFALSAAWAGPPFRTDDPEPVEFHHWEFYLASQLSHDDNGTTGTLPHVEVNYGIAFETQLHLIVPLSFNRLNTGDFSYGPGDIELGIKYRFIGESAFHPQVGVFPLLEIPTGNESKGLGNGHAQFFLPLWAQKSIGDWTLYGGGGYLFNFASDRANTIFLGQEGQYDISKSITLAAELFGVINPANSIDNELAFSVGAIVNFSESDHFLFSAGRDIRGNSDIVLYAAYQRTW